MKNELLELIDHWKSRAKYQRNFKKSLMRDYRDGVADGIEDCIWDILNLLPNNALNSEQASPCSCKTPIFRNGECTHCKGRQWLKPVVLA